MNNTSYLTSDKLRNLQDSRASFDKLVMPNVDLFKDSIKVDLNKDLSKNVHHDNQLKSEQTNNDQLKNDKQQNDQNKAVKTDALESDKGEESKRPWWRYENRTSYSVLRNYIIANNQRIDVDGSILKIGDFDISVTYTTQASYEFLHHAEQLCKRFDGPISIAVYAPSTEFQIAVNLIYYLRKCTNPCVSNNISWHMIYDSLMKVDNLDINKYPDEFLIDNNVNLNFNCSMKYDEYLKSLTNVFEKEADTVLNVRTKNHLPYPINVLRNVARLSANTKYVLASDIELYPSINIVKMFRKMLDKEKAGQLKLVNPTKPHVYILPIFEVEASVNAPETKQQLVQMHKKGTAIFFHKWVCDACQNFVDRDKWMTETISPNELNIFRATKRKKTYWEPLYIGTNDEPLYDERLSWDGKRDKMSQMLEMCFMDYDLLILDNAFLCHAPGIKHIDPKDQKKRLPFIKKNNQIYDVAISKLRKKYKNLQGVSSC